MIIDITNEILTELKTELNNIAEVNTSYPNKEFIGKRVTVEEIYNITNDATRDSGGHKTNTIALEVKIFTTGNTRMTDAKSIRNKVDNILNGKYRMSRDDGRPMPSQYGNEIYTYVLRYSFVIDTNKTIYRR